MTMSPSRYRMAVYIIRLTNGTFPKNPQEPACRVLVSRNRMVRGVAGATMSTSRLCAYVNCLMLLSTQCCGAASSWAPDSGH